MLKRSAAYTIGISILLALLAIFVLPDDIFGRGTAIPVGTIPEQAVAEKDETKVILNDPHEKEYQQLLKQYQAHIAGIVLENNNVMREKFQADVVYLRMHHDVLRNAESTTLEKLRFACKKYGKKVDFCGGGLEYRVLIPSSAESARIFSALDKDALLDRKAMLTELYTKLTIDELAKEWRNCLREMQLSPDNKVKELATLAIFKGGLDDAGMYRYLTDVAEGRVVIVDNNMLFDLLYNKVFFTINKKSFVREPVITEQNSKLAALLAEKSTCYQLQTICANYEIANNNIDKGINNLEKVLWTKYILVGDGDFDGVDPVRDEMALKDMDLHNAHKYALSFLFYDACTEKAFEIVYNRAFIERTERENPKSLPEEFRSFSNSNILATWEIERAEYLIQSVIRPAEIVVRHNNGLALS